MLGTNKSCFGFEFIPGVGVVELVTNKELCRVVWVNVIKNSMHKNVFLVGELLRSI